MRIGRFHGALFESAPVQLVPASNPSSAEIASGAMVDMGAGSFARRQQVVYTGVFLNEIPRLDVAQSSSTADFYLWIRFARGAGAGAADPTDVDFPDLVRGSFDAKRPAEEGDLDDGTSYRLWRVRGDFKNDFDCTITRSIGRPWRFDCSTPVLPRTGWSMYKTGGRSPVLGPKAWAPDTHRQPRRPALQPARRPAATSLPPRSAI